MPHAPLQAETFYFFFDFPLAFGSELRYTACMLTKECAMQQEMEFCAVVTEAEDFGLLQELQRAEEEEVREDELRLLRIAAQRYANAMQV
jgi:hypothetical protein